MSQYVNIIYLSDNCCMGVFDYVSEFVHKWMCEYVICEHNNFYREHVCSYVEPGSLGN